MTRLSALLACWVLLWCSGCSDPASSSANPLSAPPATSATPSPTPTEDPETPEEFVRRWVEVDRQMQNLGDTREYRRLTGACAPCKGVADQIDAIYAAGGYVKTEGLLIRSAIAGKPDLNGEVEVRLRVRSMPTEYVEESGGPLRALPGGQVTYLVTLRPFRTSWVITLLERLAQ